MRRRQSCVPGTSRSSVGPAAWRRAPVLFAAVRAVRRVRLALPARVARASRSARGDAGAARVLLCSRAQARARPTTCCARRGRSLGAPHTTEHARGERGAASRDGRQGRAHAPDLHAGLARGWRDALPRGCWLRVGSSRKIVVRQAPPPQRTPCSPIVQSNSPMRHACCLRAGALGGLLRGAQLCDARVLSRERPDARPRQHTPREWRCCIKRVSRVRLHPRSPGAMDSRAAPTIA